MVSVCVDSDCMLWNIQWKFLIGNAIFPDIEYTFLKFPVSSFSYVWQHSTGTSTVSYSWMFVTCTLIINVN